MVLLLLLCSIAVLQQASARFESYQGVCCDFGQSWATAALSNGQDCHEFRDDDTMLAQVSMQDKGNCRKVVEVCCLKMKQSLQCELGAARALEKSSCAATHEQGKEALTECCNCCQLGMVARAEGTNCNVIDIDNPCGTSFIRCCNNGTTPGRGPCANHICEQTCHVVGEHAVCGCRAGYRTKPRRDDQCEDIDECDSGRHNCGSRQRCVNTPGSYRCESGEVPGCTKGYMLVESTCVDVDECYKMEHNCRRDQDCVNTEGSFTCDERCRPGTVRQGDGCVPIVTQKPDGGGSTFDCSKCSSGRCEVHDAKTCYCESGYREEKDYRGKSTCVDVNECHYNNNPCGHTELRCENTIGSYECRRRLPCFAGYEIDARSQNCEDVNECMIGKEQGEAMCSPTHTCFNLPGTFRCEPKTCPHYMVMNRETGECDEPQCKSGYKALRSGRCVDINECVDNSHNCTRHQNCLNSDGGFRCQNRTLCRRGYLFNLHTGQCDDIKECDVTPGPCVDSEICVERRGGYDCQCPPGHEKKSSGRCEDMNECLQRGICGLSATCENTVGSFMCLCKDGYEKGSGSSSRYCQDIDECNRANQCSSNAICYNSPGNYSCSCSPGFVLADDRRTCVDVDECKVVNGGRYCQGQCINTPGSYQCSCPAGYRKQNKMCYDIDECAADDSSRAQCQHPSKCFNVKGGYRCVEQTCATGYTRIEFDQRRLSFQCKRDSCGRNEQICENGPLKICHNYRQMPPSQVKNPTTIPIFRFGMNRNSNVNCVLNYTVEWTISEGLGNGTTNPAFAQREGLVASQCVRKATINDFRLDTTEQGRYEFYRVRPLCAPQDFTVNIEIFVDVITRDEAGRSQKDYYGSFVTRHHEVITAYDIDRIIYMKTPVT